MLHTMALFLAVDEALSSLKQWCLRTLSTMHLPSSRKNMEGAAFLAFTIAVSSPLFLQANSKIAVIWIVREILVMNYYRIDCITLLIYLPPHQAIDEFEEAVLSGPSHTPKIVIPKGPPFLCVATALKITLSPNVLCPFCVEEQTFCLHHYGTTIGHPQRRECQSTPLVHHSEGNKKRMV